MLRPASARSRVVVLAALGAYVLALALVAFWPTHVDEGAGHLLQAITRRFPWATYGRIEFSANIALFAPLGLLLTLLVRPWWWVIAAGALASSAIELCQGLFLAGRTASPWDVAANTLGTIAGVVIGIIWSSSSSRVRAPA